MARLEPFKWKKGQSGNPAGRPKRKSLEELVTDRLYSTKIDAQGNEIIPIEWLADRILHDLLTGRKDIFKPLLDRLWPEIQKHLLDGSLDLNGAREELRERLERLRERDLPEGSDE